MYIQLLHTEEAEMIAVTTLNSKIKFKKFTLKNSTKIHALLFYLFQFMLVFMNYIYFAPDYHGKVVDYLDLKQMSYQIKADC